MKKLKVLKRAAIFVFSSAFALFAVYNFAWMWQHVKFESLKMHHAPEEQEETPVDGYAFYSHANVSSFDNFYITIPKYLHGYGNVCVYQNFDMCSDTETQKSPDDEYSIRIQANLHLLQKTEYNVQLTYNGDFIHDNPEWSRGGDYFVDKDMNLLDTEKYTEKEINLYNSYRDKIKQQYQKCLDFYGKENIEKL
ncbi:MAG: hypothetical protein Q4F95_02440 [Oscillospiraceae bacterium]|nr:hypothetical protein [Oscillospiraceae bacterium]